MKKLIKGALISIGLICAFVIYVAVRTHEWREGLKMKLYEGVDVTSSLKVAEGKKRWVISTEISPAGAKGAWNRSSVLQARPSYYYRFSANQKTIESIVSELKLKKDDYPDISGCSIPPEERFKSMVSEWWVQGDFKDGSCYSGNLFGMDFAVWLWQDPKNELAYLHVVDI